jgi:hypothetical protein
MSADDLMMGAVPGVILAVSNGLATATLVADAFDAAARGLSGPATAMGAAAALSSLAIAGGLMVAGHEIRKHFVHKKFPFSL